MTAEAREMFLRYLRQQREFGYPPLILGKSEEPLPGAMLFEDGRAEPGTATATAATTTSATPESAVAAPDSDGDESSAASLSELRDSVGDCRLCGLHEKRSKLVFGVGNENADLMFIGEGPGADEDRIGEPFVGKAGQLLDKILIAAGIKREDVYITNIVKCRPPGNRDPQPDEVATCNPVLKRQIELVKPRIICALGRFASQTLLKSNDGIGRLRGRWYDHGDIKLICTYHPSACLRNESYKRPVWNDFKMLRDEYRKIRSD